MKTCSVCHEDIPLSEYTITHRRVDGSPGYRNRCRPCFNTTRVETRTERRARALLFRYGLTHNDYEAMLAAQGGVCAVCSQPETRYQPDGTVYSLCVDHDHNCCPGRVSCGECIRGLLCYTCNVALGHLDTYISSAAAYVIGHHDRMYRGEA